MRSDDYLDNSSLHTIWHLHTQNRQRWRWGGLCGVLGVCSKDTIVTSLTLFLCLYCQL